MALFAIDFDYTIASGHTHNIIYTSGERDPQKQWQQVQDVKPIISKITGKTWNDAFKQLIKDNHQIAIVSFNAFAHIIPRYLQEVIKLNEIEIKQIKSVLWLPQNPLKADKNEHIAAAIRATRYTGPVDEVILIDDSIKNCTAASLKDYLNVIASPENGDHIDCVIQLSKAYANKEKKELNEPLKKNGFLKPPALEQKSATCVELRLKNG